MNTIIIESIGTANPGISKVLADAFEINHEMLAKMLYNAPTVFIENANDELTQKAEALLSSLGLEIKVQDSGEALPQKSEPVDVAVYVNNPLNINKVAGQLSEFIGISNTEALQLLLSEPGVVLGGVSLATANTLQKRIDAEVIASNPKNDLYCIHVNSNQSEFINQFTSTLKQLGINYNRELSNIENLNYQQAQTIWKRFPNTKNFVIYNQSYRRYKILLDKFDLNKQISIRFLIDEIGMPQEIIETIHQNLPIILDESLNINMADKKLQVYIGAGLDCSIHPIPFGKFKISISNINNREKVEKVLAQFYENTKLSNDTEKWTAPLPLNSILNRFLEKQLELIGCEVEHEYA
ncbi:MAG: hypothetical protein PF484_01875 [Bacteroidales bacterium]|jgi:hypothetical protein|nr:hypothetical protein [Bacteroidales bacterium]